jgi:hypothetical protein
MRRSIVALSLAALMLLIWPATALAATQPRLGTATSFAVLAAAGITNSGTTTITGDVGTYPTPAETGFASVTILSGTNHAADAVTQGARVDEVTAYNDLANQTPCTVLSGGALDGRNLVPGCYKFSSAAILNVDNTLTLNGFGVYVFQIGSDLTIGNGSRVLLTGDPAAVACGVYWQVTGSATIGTATPNFVGTLIAGSSISVNTNAVWTGRALAGALAPSGAVTLLTNTITRPPALCAGLPTTSGTVSPGNTGVPLDLRGQFPWLLLIGVGAGLGATAMGVSRRRRRRNA